MRIRHYGFLANCCRKTKLAHIRQRLAQDPGAEAVDEQRTEPSTAEPWRCPKCHQGHLHIVQAQAPRRFDAELFR